MIPIHYFQSIALSSLFLYSLHSICLCSGKKIAIIGGGISGTFAAKYITDYDKKCVIDEITVFDPSQSVIGEHTTPNNGVLNYDTDNNIVEYKNMPQGSRVSSLKLNDGTVIELGASIVYTGNHLVVDMINGDPDNSLEMGEPFHTGKDTFNKDDVPSSLGIYSGNGDWPTNFASITADKKWMIPLKLLYRYNIDLYHMQTSSKRALASFDLIPMMLNSSHADTFFTSPDEMWKAVGLYKASHVSFTDFMDSLGMTSNNKFTKTSTITSLLSTVKNLLPYQGSLRDEFLEAININNYNQNNDELNALVGLASFVTTSGKLFSIVGGNVKLLSSAMKQANKNRKESCIEKKHNINIKHVQKKVSTVVGDIGKFELFASSPDNELLGEYDIVVVAVPLQQSNIDFLITSHFDGSILQPMPIGGMIENLDNEDEERRRSKTSEETEEEHVGHDVLPKELPTHATIPFTQVVTTIISGATLNPKYFHLSNTKDLPRSILFTEKGKVEFNGRNVTTVTHLTSNGVYKVFSSNELTEDILDELFVNSIYKIEHVKVWGGRYGGATPNYRGDGSTMNYILYDSSVNLDGHTKGSGVLYYPNAIEGSMACIELSALGAKSVAKLIAKKLNLVDIKKDENMNRGEEL